MTYHQYMTHKDFCMKFKKHKQIVYDIKKNILFIFMAFK